MFYWLVVCPRCSSVVTLLHLLECFLSLSFSDRESLVHSAANTLPEVDKSPTSTEKLTSHSNRRLLRAIGETLHVVDSTAEELSRQPSLSAGQLEAVFVFAAVWAYGGAASADGKVNSFARFSQVSYRLQALFPNPTNFYTFAGLADCVSCGCISNEARCV